MSTLIDRYGLPPSLKLYQRALICLSDYKEKLCTSEILDNLKLKETQRPYLFRVLCALYARGMIRKFPEKGRGARGKKFYWGLKRAGAKYLKYKGWGGRWLKHYL